MVTDHHSHHLSLNLLVTLRKFCFEIQWTKMFKFGNGFIIIRLSYNHLYKIIVELNPWIVLKMSKRESDGSIKSAAHNNAIGDGMTDDTVIGDNQLGDKTESQRLYSNYAQVTV